MVSLLSQTLEAKSLKPETSRIWSKVLDTLASPIPAKYLVSNFLKQMLPLITVRLPVGKLAYAGGGVIAV